MTEKPIPCGNNVDQNAISLKATHQKSYLEWLKLPHLPEAQFLHLKNKEVGPTLSSLLF